MSDFTSWNEIAERTPTGLVVIDRHGDVVQFNHAAKGLLNSIEIGKSWLILIKQCFSPKEDDGHEVSTTDGKRISISITSIAENNGELITMNDLTATRVYQQKRSTQDRYSVMGRMLSHLAHQIRTPLASAKLYLKNLNHPQISNEKGQIYQEKINYCHQCIEKQINDLLLFAKGGNSIIETVTIVQLIDHIAKQSEINRVHHDIQLTIHNDIPDKKVIVNIDTLSSALNNIIDNAINANARNISIDCHYINNEIFITFIDDGDGMDESTLSKIFEPFFTTRAKGTGLGMAVVDAVIRAHHGRIEVTSNVGQGSQFNVCIPEATNNFND